MDKKPKYIRWFNEIKIEDIPLVGGKNASLGEMYTNLTQQGVKLPNGFAITSNAYLYLLQSGNILEKIKQILGGINKKDLVDFNERALAVRELIYQAPLPVDLVDEVNTAYETLCREYNGEPDVAVRSSATAEDLPTASFAGQQDTFLNVRGKGHLIEACRNCFASLFTDRAISYRMDNGFDHLKVALSIGVMKMIRSDLAASGVMFTLDTETGFKDVVYITGIYGLGENIVQGMVNPDEFYVYKPTLNLGYRPILQKALGDKKIKMVYGKGPGRILTKNIAVPFAESKKFCISEDEVLELARYALIIEDYYSKKFEEHRPMDIEWAKDGNTGELFIVQARPETVQSQRSKDILESYHLEGEGTTIIRGKSVGEKIASGKAHIFTGTTSLDNFRPGEVLVADITTPDWEPIMKIASAIVTNRGGRTCHAAIISRELGIPAVVGTLDATEKIAEGEMITVSCAEGTTGNVYQGEIPFKIDRVVLTDLKRPKTKIMINLGDPEKAFSMCQIPNDGVGLARMEFIINNYIKVHPMALVHPEKVTDEKSLAEINQLTRGYKDKTQYFVDKLAEGVATIAAAFYPKPVVVRMSDFKTNEYAKLLGGAVFEPEEENPMIGFRGASRYYDKRYREGFALECRAIKRVRDEMGLTNVILMIPFCRRVDEGKKVLKEMRKNGLKRGENGLQIYVMCEIPNNVLLIDDFCKIFDGFSIGSNDLTQLILGVDRDSEIVAFEFDERDHGIIKAISMAIQGARCNNCHSGICGQAPSDYPEFAEFLVKEGIESISLNPDSVIKVTLNILDIEKNLAR